MRLTHLFVLTLALAMPAAFGDGGSARAAAGVELSKAQPSGEVEGFVQANIDKGYAILNNKGISTNERERQFREFLLSIIDTKRAALFTLGGFAKTASQPDLDAFLATYDDFAAAMYQGYFNWYTGQSLRVANSIARSADDVVVYADVVNANGSRLYKVGFRVRKDSNQKNVVTDFQFEGVWLALNQRADFTAYLQQHKGDFTTLTAELQKRTQRFRDAWAPPQSKQ